MLTGGQRARSGQTHVDGRSPARGHPHQILAQGLAHASFRDRGRRAQGLHVAINAIDYLSIDLS